MRKTSPAPFPKAKLGLLLGWFTLVNSLLSFAPLPGVAKAVLLGLGLILPMAWFFRNPLKISFKKPAYQEELFPMPSWWILCLLLLAAGCFRFIQLTTLSLWPLTDEAKSGYYAMQLAVYGKAQFLYDFSQLPPLYIWLQGLFFKLAGVSLQSLWFFPALLSLLTAVVSYPAARAHFSKSFSFLFAGLTAFSFWPLYVGRFSHQGSLLLLWEWLALWMAGTMAKAGKDLNLKKYGFYLGLLTGAGFYTFTSWPTVGLVLTLWVFFFHRRAVVFFLAGTVLVYLPLGTVWFKHNYGGYIQHVWAFDPSRGWVPQILQGFWDFSALFWKSQVPSNLFAYKPFWGGYLNPLLAACFFLGVLVFFQRASRPWGRFIPMAFMIFYLPGFLTGGVEMFRILPLLPLLLAGAALGFTMFLASLKTSWRLPALGLFFLASLGMDGYHLFGVYHRVWTEPKDNWFASKSVDRLRAYQILRDWQKQAGPGLILPELVPDLYDQSLSTATFEFNAEQNPELASVPPRWAAFFTNIHYQDCLAKDFPETRWVRLAPDMGWPDGGDVLGIMPLPCSDPQKLIRLIQADRSSHDMVPLVYDHRDYIPRQPVVDRLHSLYPLFQGNRFLESCFWEKVADNDYGDGNYEGQALALQKAIEKGCPAAHLYNDLGALYLRRSRFKEARQAFEKALLCKPNYTSAAAGLALLEQTEKTGQRPKD